jgi:tetratricopeptide (TPR) repeat protein
MYPEALRTFQKRADTSGRDAGIEFSVAQAYAMSGDMTKALQILEEAKAMNRNQPGNAWSLTQIYRVLADRDKRYRDDMYAWLDKAYEERSMGLVFTSTADWAPYRSDPRFIAFRKKLGLTP